MPKKRRLATGNTFTFLGYYSAGEKNKKKKRARVGVLPKCCRCHFLTKTMGFRHFIAIDKLDGDDEAARVAPNFKE